MSGSRRLWLKELASRSKAAWLSEECPEEHEGITRVETRRTIYSFKDGICIEVTRRTYEPVGDSHFIGLKLVGWAGDDDEVLAAWRPGARAILWRPSAPGEETAIALTSASFGFHRLTRRDVDEEITLMSLRRGIARPEPAPLSVTRVHAAMMSA